MLKIFISAWTKKNVEFIENQTKTRQSGLSAKPRLLKSSQFENMPRTMFDFRLLLHVTLTKNFAL